MCIFEKSLSQNPKTGFELTIWHVVFELHDTLPFLLVIGRRNTIRKKQEKHEEKEGKKTETAKKYMEHVISFGMLHFWTGF